MTPASLARHSIEAAGPSVYARKVSTSPLFAGGRAVQWVTEIPMTKFPGYTMRIVMSEFYVPVQGGRHSFDIHIVEHPPNAQIEFRHPRNITGKTTLITTTYEKRADAYQTLYRYVNFIREVCQGSKQTVIRQRIADKTQEVQEKNLPVRTQSGREWDKQTENSENYSEASAVELASVLLEINVAEFQMTPKELAIQAVGLPVMARRLTTDKGDSVEQKHYQWVSDHDYKIKLSLVEIFQTAQIPGMPERPVPHYRVVIKPYVETTPTIYDGFTAVTLFDMITPENKGKMYTALWKMFQDIEHAHEAGMEASDMIPLLGEVFRLVKLKGELDRMES